MQMANEIAQLNVLEFVPANPLPVLSLYPRRAMSSIAAVLFSSFPQKDSVTGMVNWFFVPEYTTLTQKQDKKTQTQNQELFPSYCPPGGLSI